MKEPKDFTREETKELLRKLKKKEIEAEKIPEVIRIFGRTHFKEGIKEIEKYVNSEDEVVRYSALSALILDFHLKEHYKTARRLLFEDDDEDVRGMAAACLGNLMWNTEDKKTLQVLLNIFENETEHWLVRDSAYSAVLNVLGIHWKYHPSSAKHLNYNTGVDWNLIRAIKKYLKDGGKSELEKIIENFGKKVKKGGLPSRLNTEKKK